MLVGESELSASWQHSLESVGCEVGIEGLVFPQTQAELAAVMAEAFSRQCRVLPAGCGTKLGWGGLPDKVDWVVSTEKINGLIEHAAGDMTVTAEAGMRLSTLQGILHQQGQFLPLDPPYAQEATLGGMISTNVSGSLRHGYGGVRDLLIGLSFVRADGQVAKAGGRVVKNVAGYDLMKLFTGAYGTLGIISQVTFRVYPLPGASETVLLVGESTKIAELIRWLRMSVLTPARVDSFSGLVVEGLGLGKGMGLLVGFAGGAESVKQQSERLLEVGLGLGLDAEYFRGDDKGDDLWQRLKDLMWQRQSGEDIVCRIGVKPSDIESVLAGFDSLGVLGMIHVGSGLGVVNFSGLSGGEVVEKLRCLCVAKDGFLSILEAPKSIKENVDVWGYKSAGLLLMKEIKRQFDAKNILAGGRFVGGI